MKGYRVKWWRVQPWFAQHVFTDGVYHTKGNLMCRNWRWARRAQMRRR